MDKTTNSDFVLQHWGIKGQKWGRRRYQNKDGSLTPEGRKHYGNKSSDSENSSPKLSRKQRKEKLRKEAEEAKAKEEAETTEQKRARLLKSSDAGELYKNRDLLSTAEINERLNRIDTERRLAKAAEDAKPAKKTFTERVDGALKVGKKINEVYEFTNTPVMKALKKKLGIEKGDDESKFDVEKIYKNRDKLSNKEIQEAATRADNYDKIRKFVENKAGESNKVANETVSNAKSKVKDKVDKVSKSDTLKKEAAKEIVKEVGPELSEIVETFNTAITKANQKRLDNNNYYSPPPNKE